MLVEDVLDLARPDLVAGDDDHVLDPVDEVEPTVGVALADVARVQPAVDDRLFAFLRPVPVARRDPWPAGEDLALLAGGGLAAVHDRDHPRLGVDDREPDRERAGVRVDRRAPPDRHQVRGRRGLGQAVGVVEVGAGRLLLKAFDHGRGGRGRRLATWSSMRGNAPRRGSSGGRASPGRRSAGRSRRCRASARSGAGSRRRRSGRAGSAGSG